VELKPERPFVEEMDAEEFSDPSKVADVPRHRKNWLDCIRHGGTPNGNIEIALKAHVVLCLGEMSERLSLTLHYDEKTRKVLTSDGKKLKPISYDTAIRPVA
jgi:hypothetical protein